MPVRTAALTHALATVDEDTFVRRPDGNLVTQSSSQQIIADMIDRLDVRPGMTVLEVGTGSGYSTALLATLVGREGLVLSIDVVAELVVRANTLLPAHGYPNTTVVRADGAQGAPDKGPFDRIIAWATATHIPSAWTTQLAGDGLIVAPLTAAPISKSGIGAVIELAADATPYVNELFPAGFVEMHGQELDQWVVPPYGIDVLGHDNQRRPWWLSAEWIRSPHRYLEGHHVLDVLVADPRTVPGPLEPGEPAADLRAWLLATRPDGLTTAALGDPLWRIGRTDATGAALTDLRTATETITTGDLGAAEALSTWVATWRRDGRPGLADLRPHLQTSHDGWVLRADVG